MLRAVEGVSKLTLRFWQKPGDTSNCRLRCLTRRPIAQYYGFFGVWGGAFAGGSVIRRLDQKYTSVACASMLKARYRLLCRFPMASWDQTQIPSPLEEIVLTGSTCGHISGAGASEICWPVLSKSAEYCV
jgi:hypothetical protein